MDSIRLIFGLVFVLSTPVLAQRSFVPVFTAGSDGYSSYRIPAIIRSPDGSLLAFCEGRVHNAGDFGNIDIVMKTSRDMGKTWSPLQVIVDVDDLQAGNPAPVVDLTDPAFPRGRIFLFYNTGNNHEQEVRKGNGRRDVWYTCSVDAGRSWSAPVNITSQVHHPDLWRSYANTPGHAIQVASGRFKGRIFVAANHSEGDPQEGSADYSAHGFYTDDHGRSFHVGASLKIPGSNESTAAHLGGDRLMMNSRNQRGDIKTRIVSMSSDGGASWDTTYFDHQLPDPVNEGSLLAIQKKKGKMILAFTNAADTTQRNHLTLRFSHDAGQSWKNAKLIYAGTDPNIDYAAYSDLVFLGKNKLGTLFEKDDYTSIVFTVDTLH